ncbi:MULTISPECIES: hypothetical protein [Trichocoleus]|uniref:Uncharacterized protein n=1 Tax=Trichocoleus desertorum GB2-A4 TaxID=2933944 RepID=A0ABV0JGV1_9CYAN|nr:hypothetical protein [Trichocoleus sp. FACHB-46]MBD1865074.1 hypothetical protein [Trichocoleus sp. FACHB-46]
MASSTPGSNGNHKPILTGNTVLDKLLNQLEEGDRGFKFLRWTELNLFRSEYGAHIMLTTWIVQTNVEPESTSPILL